MSAALEVSHEPRGVEAPPLPSGAPYVATGLALTGAGAAAVWMAGHVAPDAVLHEVALFAHLACLVLGFGAVLTVDWLALLWLLGRCELSDVLHQAGRVTVPIWAGYGGLVLSGVLLSPDLTSPVTVAKLALVLLIGWNGILATWLHSRLIEDAGRFSFRVSAGFAAVSQLGWWGAMVIGFTNSR